MKQPFITFYTPTYRRPQHLAACMESVRLQTAADDVEQVVIVDHVGLGVGGMFATVPDYAAAVHGQYVHMLADDDLLYGPDVVERLREFAVANGYPPVIIVKSRKDTSTWPVGRVWPPQMGAIDLGCIVARSDVWKDCVKGYGDTYEGDYHFAKTVYEAGHDAKVLDLLFLVGKVMRGSPEVLA